MYHVLFRRTVKIKILETLLTESGTKCIVDLIELDESLNNQKEGGKSNEEL